MKTTPTAIAVGLMLAVLIGCSGDTADDAAPQETETSTAATPTPSPTPTKNSFEPDTGPDALEVGETRDGQQVDTTVLEIRDPYPPAYARTPLPGNRFIGIRLRSCIQGDAVDQGFGWQAPHEGDFFVQDARRNLWADEGPNWINFPQPHFPALRELRPGDCVQGWLAISTPKKVKPVLLQFAPGGEHVADWRFPKP